MAGCFLGLADENRVALLDGVDDAAHHDRHMVSGSGGSHRHAPGVVVQGVWGVEHSQGPVGPPADVEPGALVLENDMGPSHPVQCADFADGLFGRGRIFGECLTSDRPLEF